MPSLTSLLSGSCEVNVCSNLVRTRLVVFLCCCCCCLEKATGFGSRDRFCTQKAILRIGWFLLPSLLSLALCSLGSVGLSVSSATVSKLGFAMLYVEVIMCLLYMNDCIENLKTLPFWGIFQWKTPFVGTVLCFMFLISLMFPLYFSCLFW